jgi:hypothetical protein
MFEAPPACLSSHFHTRRTESSEASGGHGGAGARAEAEILSAFV